MEKQDTKYLIRIAKLFDGSQARSYPKNQLLHYQGDPLHHIYTIKKGYIKAYTILDSGDTRTILLLGPGDIFPLAFSSTMDWANYKVQYFYQSMTDVQLLSVAGEKLRSHMESDTEAMKTYIAYLAASNEAILNQLEVMKNKKAIDKVSSLLPYLISKIGKQTKPGIYQLQLKLSHQELADLSGVTRETVTTLIKQLEKDGVIDQKPTKWIINTNNLEKYNSSR